MTEQTNGKILNSVDSIKFICKYNRYEKPLKLFSFRIKTSAHARKRHEKISETAREHMNKVPQENEST